MRAIVLVALFLALPQFAIADEKSPVLLKGHTGWVGAVAFSPDGKTLASASADNTVRLWDVPTGKEKTVLNGHTDYVCTVAFSPDGKTLATGSFDHTVKLWDIPTRRENKTLAGHSGAVLTVAFHPEGKILVTGGVDGSVRMWDLDKGKSRILPGHKSWVNTAVFTPANDVLATGGSDGLVNLMVGPHFDKCSGSIGPGAGEVRSVAFKGRVLAVGNRYGTVKIFLVPGKQGESTVTLKGFMGDVWAIAFSPDGKTLAVADTDWKKPGAVKLFDTETWRERSSLSVPAEILCLAYSPDGKWLAVGSWDKTVRLFPVGR